MAFQIRMRDRGYDDLFAAMVAAIPPGTFYDHSRPICMWSRKPQGFILETDNPGYPIRIRRERLGDFDLGVDAGNLVEETTVVPQPGALNTLFYITLGRGRNRLYATEILPSGGGRSFVFEVIATTNTLIYESYGREIFKSVYKAAKQEEALYSAYSTRLLDQLAGIGDVLPDLQTLKTLSTKMLIRSFVHFPATELGVRNKIEAVTLNTPIFIKQRESSEYQVETNRIMRSLENTAGMEGHVWFPNLAVTRWLAYTKMADTFRNNYTILDVKDTRVKVEYKGKQIEHFFDYDAYGQNFLTNLSLKDCFNNFEIGATSQFLLNLRICCWTYPFDMSITESNPIGLTRASLDSPIPFDSNVPFDADPVDPWNDGFVGWSYSGRFELDDTPRPLDSMVSPSPSYSGSICAYQGPYTQSLNSCRSDVEIEHIVTASGDMDTYVGGPIIGLGLDFNNTDVGVELEGRSFKAGEPILLCVKYVDANNMTNVSGTGIIAILEPLSGIDEFAPVTAGFVYIYFTPTLATPSTAFSLSDGMYTGTSESFSVYAGDWAALTVTPISDHVAGTPFSVNIQAVDSWGNPVTDVGFDTLVHILPSAGLSAGNPTPNSVWLVNGQATVNLTCNWPSTGKLKFKLGAIEVDSNTFTVS